MKIGLLIMCLLASVIGGLYCTRKYGSIKWGALGAGWTFFASGGLVVLLDLVRS